MEPAIKNDKLPTTVAVCPECGSQLCFDICEWVEETGQPTIAGVYVDCMVEDLLMQEWEENDAKGINDLRDIEHRHWQSEWQPVIDKVCKHLGAVDA
jgi:hypothetical protein